MGYSLQTSNSRELSASQRIGSIKFGDNNLGAGSGSGAFSPLMIGLVLLAGLIGLWIWKR